MGLQLQQPTLIFQANTHSCILSFFSGVQVAYGLLNQPEEQGLVAQLLVNTTIQSRTEWKPTDFCICLNNRSSNLKENTMITCSGTVDQGEKRQDVQHISSNSTDKAAITFQSFETYVPCCFLIRKLPVAVIALFYSNFKHFHSAF